IPFSVGYRVSIGIYGGQNFTGGVASAIVLECPAPFVTWSGRRGGGTTTILHMIQCIPGVLGSLGCLRDQSAQARTRPASEETAQHTSRHLTDSLTELGVTKPTTQPPAGFRTTPSNKKRPPDAAGE